MRSRPGTALTPGERSVLTLWVVVVAAALGALLVLDPGPSPATGSVQRPGSAPAGGTLHPEDFGAVGDGRNDDTRALQTALDALGPGDALVLGRGRAYRHAQVLVVRRPGARLVGPGALLASDEERSALQLDAPDVHVAGVELRIAQTTRRWTTPQQHRLVLGPHEGIVVTAVRVDGSAGAGIFVDGAQRFLLVDVHVSATRADGIHVTGGARHGVVRRPVVVGSGDDGVAVVSYQADRSLTRDISVESPRVQGTTWGRGVSVVGGADISYRDVRVEGSSAAAVYIATEGDPYFTRSTERVSVVGADLLRANTSGDVDHGAVLVSAAAAGTHVRDVHVTDVTIRDTRPGASRQVGVLEYDGEASGVEMTDFRLWGGGEAFQSTAGPGAVRRAAWLVDGRAVAGTDER